MESVPADGGLVIATRTDTRKVGKSLSMQSMLIHLANSTCVNIEEDAIRNVNADVENITSKAVNYNLNRDKAVCKKNEGSR